MNSTELIRKLFRGMKYILVVFIFLFQKIEAQKPEAAILFENALKNFNSENYRAADSLFTLSNNIEPCMEVYYNRAICRGKLANKLGCCEDLAQASVLGEERATRMYVKSCGKIDTTYLKLEQNYTTTTILSKVLKYHYLDTLLVLHTQKYAGQESSSSATTDIHSDKEVHRIVETQTEFPGGIPAMTKFINQNKIVPKSLSTDEKVFLRFIVYEDGSLHDIKLLKGSNSCGECNEEAMRLVAIMPGWVPATMNGNKVKCYFNLPISFKKN